jgi:hypothetical protein
VIARARMLFVRISFATAKNLVVYVVPVPIVILAATF